MKKIFLALIIIISFTQIKAQSVNDTFQTISTYFTQNNAQALSNKFAQTLDLTIADTDGTFGKNQASVLMTKFFKENKTTSFKINHKGASNARTHYAVCNLLSGDKEWNVYILLNKESEIIQLQIEE